MTHVYLSLHVSLFILNQLRVNKNQLHKAHFCDDCTFACENNTFPVSLSEFSLIQHQQAKWCHTQAYFYVILHNRQFSYTFALANYTKYGKMFQKITTKKVIKHK